MNGHHRYGLDPAGNTNRPPATAAPPPGAVAREVRFAPPNREQNSPSLLDLVLGLFTAGIATGCLAGMMTVLVALYVTVRPFSLSTYRRLTCAWGLAPFLDAISLLLPSTRICWTGDSEVPSPIGSAVLVANHVVAADWWALFMLGRCVGLQGTLKVFLRNEYLNLNMDNVAPAAGDPGTGVGGVNGTTNGSVTNVSSAAGTGTLANGGHHHHHAQQQQHYPSNSAAGSASCRRQQQQHQQEEQAQQRQASPDLALMAKLLHQFLEFPLISTDRGQLSALLRSFADAEKGSPVHLLHYPEGWCNHNGADRQSVLAKSNEFAKREGKPVLKHLLLPRTRGFLSSLECLRESRPIIYDVTLAYIGYDGSLPAYVELSMPTLWDLLRRRFPKEVHMRIQRYTLDEVLQDSNWLFKRWSEKDRLLAYFARHQQFPVGASGRHRVFDTRTYALETSLWAMVKLLVLPCCVPLLLLISFPLVWTLLVIWCGQHAYQFIFAEPATTPSDNDSRNGNRSDPQTPGSASLSTPYLPATPFASPSLLNWRDMMPKNGGAEEGKG